MTSFELTPGVVVDRDQGEIYAMSPDGGVDAVDLGSGEVLRHSPNAAKPLAVSGSVLVGQTEPAGLGNELDIVAFDIHDPGARITRSRVELPSGVQASIQQSANRAFTAHAEPSEASATVSWEFVERPLQGIPSGPVEVQPGETTPPEIAGPDASGIEEAENEFGDLIIAHGAVRVELADGAITPVEQPPPAALADATPLLPSAAAADLAPASRLPDQPEPQFLSADGTHVLISERIENDLGWANRYRWRVFDRDGQLLGEVHSHVRFAPFFVRGSQIVYPVEPHVHREGDTLIEEPVQIRAADMTSGAILWSHPVRDIIDREAPPS